MYPQCSVFSFISLCRTFVTNTIEARPAIHVYVWFVSKMSKMGSNISFYRFPEHNTFECDFTPFFIVRLRALRNQIFCFVGTTNELSCLNWIFCCIQLISIIRIGGFDALAITALEFFTFKLHMDATNESDTDLYIQN